MTPYVADPVYLNGRFLPLAEAGISPLDRGFLYGDGVYELIPVYSRRPFRLAGKLGHRVSTLGDLLCRCMSEWPSSRASVVLRALLLKVPKAIIYIPAGLCLALLIVLLRGWIILGGAVAVGGLLAVLIVLGLSHLVCALIHPVLGIRREGEGRAAVRQVVLDDRQVPGRDHDTALQLVVAVAGRPGLVGDDPLEALAPGGVSHPQKTDQQDHT